MKTFVTAFLICLATFASAENNIDLELEESPRFGYFDLNNNGATMTFNSTSLQYAVISGVVLLIVAIAVIPLLGYDLTNIFSNREGSEPVNYAYDHNQAYSSYSAYARRSLDALSPVLKALSDAYHKYQ